MHPHSGENMTDHLAGAGNVAEATERGTRVEALFYSVIGSAKLRGVEPLA